MNPQPADISKLKAILANSRKVMHKVENTTPIVLSEATQRQVDYEDNIEPSYEAQQPRGYTDEQVMNSRLPAAVKEAMIKNKIPQLSGPNHTFNVEDLMDPDEKPMIFNNRLSTKRLNENVKRPTLTSSDDTITITKKELNNLINEKLMDFMTNTYNKKLVEETIQRTITALIKEGKITTKK